MAGCLSTSAGVLAALSVAVLLSGASAGAQSPCAGEYVMRPGDTLHKVTQQCRVPLPELRAANPQIGNVRNIPVGSRINIPGATDGDGDLAPPQATRKDAADDGAGMHTVEGRLAHGAECMQLNTPDGRSYSLTGAGARFKAGDYVRVKGEIAEMSFCMQGEATISVESITRAEPLE